MGCKIILGTMQVSSFSGRLTRKLNWSDSRIFCISTYRFSTSTSRRRGTNSSAEIQNRRISARFVDISATCGTWLILLIHFMVSSVLHRKWGFS